MVSQKAFPIPERPLVNETDQVVVVARNVNQWASSSHVSSAATVLGSDCYPESPKQDFGPAKKHECLAEQESPERLHRTDSQGTYGSPGSETKHWLWGPAPPPEVTRGFGV